jgi:hypothetical protein
VNEKENFGMATDVLPGASNVVRFPIEERGRPTLELLRTLAPDLRTVDIVSEAFGLELPSPNFRDRVDGEAAEHIVNNVEPHPGAQRSEQLSGLLQPLVVAAVEAARVSRRAWSAVSEGRRKLAQARRAGGFWLQALVERVDVQERQAVEATMEAYLRAEEAEGVARAVSLARSGQAWAPRSTHADMETLLDHEASVREIV